MITLPETAITDLTAQVGTIFTDLWLVIALVIGLPLAFYVIKKIISMFASVKK
jgi:flagellar biogenesis protein FliO